MFTRRLGRSNIEVRGLGLGCMEIGGEMKDFERSRRLQRTSGLSTLAL
jgi:aryl-alcohol dehydrogenase-like predicted oxidoreductase